MVVKVFNTTGAGNMADPKYSTMLYAGDHAGAKKMVGQLAANLGFDPVDAGPLSSARMLEPFACSGSAWLTSRGWGPISP